MSILAAATSGNGNVLYSKGAMVLRMIENVLETVAGPGQTQVGRTEGGGVPWLGGGGGLVGAVWCMHEVWRHVMSGSDKNQRRWRTVALLWGPYIIYIYHHVASSPRDRGVVLDGVRPLQTPPAPSVLCSD